MSGKDSSIAWPLPEVPTTGQPFAVPRWVHDFADLYGSSATRFFLLHGNVQDQLRAAGGYCNLPEYLATQVFGEWDVVLYYDQARGLDCLAGANEKRRAAMVQYCTERLGPYANWPRDPEAAFHALDRQFIEHNLTRDEKSRRSLAIILDHAEYLVPTGDAVSLSRSHGSSLVRMLRWAEHRSIRASNVVFCLIAERLSEINSRLVQNPDVVVLELPLPDRDERERFCSGMAGPNGLSELTDFTAGQLADLSNGLTLDSLNVLLAQAKRPGRRVDGDRFRQLKKALIERQCVGLLEFVQPRHTLDLVVGQEAAKERLRADAELLTKGRLDAVPMGYLFCGPVGTGKTFLAECYAGSVGIPCVVLRNFRSKYVGETEGNLEQVLTVLRSLGPVVVIVDEADAALGTREASGDSGTSGRVFGMIASQMGDTRYRGKIVWMLLTSRPDLLPIDLKRQGRAEVHIPLFYPQDEDEVRAMFLAMGRKYKLDLKPDQLPAVEADGYLSGADIESLLLAGRRLALAAGREEVQKVDLQEALNDFVPSAQGLEKEMQELSAVLECTSLKFLPPNWQKKVSAPNGRTALQERLVAIRQLLRE